VTHVRRIANRISELRPLAVWTVGIARELGCSAEKCFDVDLCVTEAVSNVIRHGYLDDREHEIGVEIARVSGMLVLRIEDDAEPFDPLSVTASQPTSLDEAGSTGRGIVLLRGGADAASYERRDGRNRLTLKFAIVPTERPRT